MKSDDFSVKIFIPSDEEVLKLFRSIRWSNMVYCPICETKNVIRRGYVRKTLLRRYLCKECGKNF